MLSTSRKIIDDHIGIPEALELPVGDTVGGSDENHHSGVGTLRDCLYIPGEDTLYCWLYTSL